MNEHVLIEKFRLMKILAIENNRSYHIICHIHNADRHKESWENCTEQTCIDFKKCIKNIESSLFVKN